MTTQHIDRVADMLAHFVCATDDTDKQHGNFQTKSLSKSYDAGNVLKINPRHPTIAYTADICAERDFALDARLLLSPVQEILGNHVEIALVAEDCVKWAAFRKIHKRPQKIWVASTGCDLYEYHTRFIFRDGSSNYAKRVAAIDKHGKPVRVIIEGTKDQGGAPDGQFAVLAASVVEDSRRPGVMLATVTDGVGLVFPVPNGEHLEVFALRDGPYSGSRRKALLHWVAKHTRKTTNGHADVNQHLRGVHSFEIDGFQVLLEAESSAET